MTRRFKSDLIALENASQCSLKARRAAAKPTQTNFMKTNPRFQFAARQGFTLIELLVVIVIIAILAGLVMSQANKIMEDGRRLQVQTVIKDLRIAIGSYQVEYNRYPVDPSMLSGSDGQDAPELQTNEQSGIITALTAISSASGGSSGGSGGGAGGANLNPKDIKFIDLPMAKNGMFGLVNATPPYKLVDLWGQTYRVLLDTNGDKQVPNPDLKNSDPKISANPNSPAPQNLPTEIAIYSWGFDKRPYTKDDIASWRQK
ncbi:type II secretion system protein [Prosthecobacter sp.]|uniref:type II secretion system protein n=1 Tax=Prosthecobacter sp. TaxID=1965333 RepID=UPI0037831D8C